MKHAFFVVMGPAMYGRTRMDMSYKVSKSCLIRCGPRHKKPCAAIALKDISLSECTTVKYLGITFENGLKLKVERIKFFQSSQLYICLCWIYCLTHVIVLFTAHLLSANSALWS